MRDFVVWGLDLASDILSILHEDKAQAIVDTIQSYIPMPL